MYVFVGYALLVLEQGGEELSLEEKPKKALHLKPTEPTPLKAVDLHRPTSNPNLHRSQEIPQRDLSSRAEASTIGMYDCH